MSALHHDASVVVCLRLQQLAKRRQRGRRPDQHVAVLARVVVAERHAALDTVAALLARRQVRLRKTLSLNISCVCTEPVLANGRFVFHMKMTPKKEAFPAPPVSAHPSALAVSH